MSEAKESVDIKDLEIKIITAEKEKHNLVAPKVMSVQLGNTPRSCTKRRAASFSYPRNYGSLCREEKALPGDVPLHFRLEKTEDTHDLHQNKRLYEIWTGKNRFYCCGRCITGPRRDLKFSLLTWGIILTFTVVYAVLAVPTLVLSVSIIFPCFSAGLLILTMLFFLLAALSDPGIIPRKELFELFGPVPEQYTAKIFDHYISAQQAITPERNRNILKAFKYCPTCRIFRPPRASHCT